MSSGANREKRTGEPDDDGFVPARWLPGGDLQTIVPSLWPAGPLEGPTESIVVRVDPRASVRVDIDRGRVSDRGTLLLLHGMGGSADSGYLVRTARSAIGRGWVTARMNLRTCGGTEPLSETLYNAGQSDDVEPVLRALESAGFPRPFAIAGFSLGGNIVLRYAGISGVECAADVVAAVNPPVDLRACVRAIERPRNRIYQSHYTRGLRRQLERFLAARGPVFPPPSRLGVRTVRQFDEAYTAVDAGFPSADAYYETASSSPRLPGIRRPTLLLSAADDPFVPVEMFAPSGMSDSVTLRLPRRGGHCGYWQRGRPRYWAGEALLDFLEPGGGA